ncbi:MAG: hypothetical protein ACPL3E_01130, partial [Minisyncoccia bacterium]
MRYILIGILVIILIVFILSIGIFQNLKSVSNFFKFNFNFPTSSMVYMPYNYSGNSFGNSNITTSSIPFKKSELSPYYGKVKIENIKNLVNEFPRYEEIVLAVNNLNNEKINITGWSLVSNKSNFVITFGLKDLDFSKVFKETNILLESGDRVKIYSTYSPVNVNFKLNKCIGYLNDYYNFIPKLPENCPKIEKRDIAHLSGLCQEYILKLNTCEIPKNFNQADPNDPRCLSYLKNINYQGCFNKNKNNFDFYEKEWRIFMGREILDDLHDR